MDLSLSQQLNDLILDLESWHCQLLFPHDAPDDSKVDLCQLMHADKSNFMLSEYQFNPEKYRGDASLLSIRKDLLLAAKHCGYELVTDSSSTSKRAFGVRRRLVLICSRHRCYKGDRSLTGFGDNVLLEGICCHSTVFSKKKQYNNVESVRPEVQPRKTKTVRPIDDEKRCPFKVAVELRIDDFWYLCKSNRFSSNVDSCTTHMWHPKLSKDEISNMPFRYASSDEKEALRRCNQSHIATSVSAKFLSTMSDFCWLPSQVKYCSAKEQELVNNLTSNLSSADQLMAYLRSRDDVSFIVLTDTVDGLVVTRGKGRPKKETVDNITFGPIYDRYVSSFDGDAKKKSLKLTDDQSMLLAVAWEADDEWQLMNMFPEVWFMDVTAGTNKEGRGLFLVAGKDSNNNGFTGVRIFLPSEQLWVFDWIFRDCLPTLLGVDVIRRNHLCVTDGDPQMYGALRAQQQLKEVWRGDHALCEWHLLVAGWLEAVKSSIPDDTYSEKLGQIAYNWIQTWFWSIETNDEFDHSLNHFWKWLSRTDDEFPSFTAAKLRIKEFVVKSLLPKREYWLRSIRLKQVSFDAKTTSVVESQNSSIKVGAIAVAPNCSLLKSTDVMLGKSKVTHLIKKIKHAKALFGTPLWTNSATSGHLTSFAEMIASSNYDRRKDFVAIQQSNCKWIVFFRQHLYEANDQTGNSDDPIPVFKRLHTVELVGGKFLCCNCGFFNRMLLPCPHVLHVIGELSTLMCHIRWHKCYMFYWGKSEHMTALLKKSSSTIPVGVPVERTIFFESLCNSNDDNNVCYPKMLWDISQFEFEKLNNIQRNLIDDRVASTTSVQVDNYESSHSNCGSFMVQEGVFSPVRVLQEAFGDTSGNNSRKSYRDCLKVFNFVFNHCQTQNGSTEELCDAMWNVYNKNVVELTSKQKPKAAANIVSFPEVHTGTKSKRQRTAGYL